MARSEWKPVMTQFENLVLETLLQQAALGDPPSDAQALALAKVEDTARLAGVAARLRDRGPKTIYHLSL